MKLNAIFELSDLVKLLAEISDRDYMDIDTALNKIWILPESSSGTTSYNAE